MLYQKPYIRSSVIALCVCIVPAVWLLSGCGSTKSDTPSPEHFTNKQQNLHEWRLDGCQLVNNQTSITLLTDGTQSHQTLRLALHLTNTPQEPPLISVLGVPTRELKLAGRRKNWSFELPTTTYATAQMMANKAYVVVEYTPQPTHKKPTPKPNNTVVSLKGLPHALLALYKRCADEYA